MDPPLAAFAFVTEIAGPFDLLCKGAVIPTEVGMNNVFIFSRGFRGPETAPTRYLSWKNEYRISITNFEFRSKKVRKFPL
jgi:hypothetical protein